MANTWLNSDGLFVKFGADEGDVVKGGHYEIDGSRLMADFVINYTDALSATAAILGSAVGTTDGSLGVELPKGARIEKVETFAQTAFTSSGTIASSTMNIGLIKASDRSTAYDATGLTTTAFVGSSFDAIGESATLAVGSTGAGTAIGTTLTENTIVSVRNSAHATHPYTAGVLLVRVYYYFP